MTMPMPSSPPPASQPAGQSLLTEQKKEPSWKDKAWKEFPRDLVAGSVMGGVAHTIVAPIERAKLLLQTQESNMALKTGLLKPYTGMLDCVVRIVKEEGFLSLWRGNGSSVLRYYPSVALNFSFKDLYRTMLFSEQKSDVLSVARRNFLAGAGAGCTALIVVYPLDIAHTRLAADVGRTDLRQFKGLLHFMKTIYQRNGMQGLYKGLPASIQGMIIHRSIYFGGFDTAKDIMLKDASYLSFWKKWLTAQLATTSAGLISYPFDTVRRRMMMQAGLEQEMYANTLDCWKRIYKMEGVHSFYRGAISNMLRGTGAALILVLYDEIKELMDWTVSKS